MRVLVVEDHVELAETIAAGLRREGMAIDTVHDGNHALVLADLYDYDVIVLDRDLPGLHGDRVCERLTGGDGRARIMMLTASGASPIASVDWGSGLTTTCPSRSRSPSSWRGSAPSRDVPNRRFPPSWSVPICSSTPPAGSPSVAARRST